MIVEEKSAAEFNCPYKVAAGKSYISCTSSRCMAWRWAVEDNPEYKHEVMGLPADPRKNPMFIRSKTHGYCGLAGQA